MTNLFNNPSNVYKTKQEIAYDSIKDAIIKCDIKPGEQLIIRVLASSLNISEIPVREALKRLISGNFILEQNSNLYVAPIESEEFLDMLEVKLALEILAIKLTARKIDEDQIAFLNSILEEMKIVFSEGKINLYKDLHNEFHLAICRMCGVPYLIKAIEDAFCHHIRGINYFNLKLWQVKPSIEEHEEILNSLAEKDEKRAIYNLTNNRVKANNFYRKQILNTNNKD